jgi:hypothetical protein
MLVVSQAVGMGVDLSTQFSRSKKSLEQFNDVKFYHGTTHDLDSLAPVNEHGGDANYPGLTRPEAAYVTTSEADAWEWAGHAQTRNSGRQRVYEVEPHGGIAPDRNLQGPQFEVGGGTIKRELPGPINSQLKLFPTMRDPFNGGGTPSDSGPGFKRFSDIAWDAAMEEQSADTQLRLNRGYQGRPQDTSLFDEDPELKSQAMGGRLPVSDRRSPYDSLSKPTEHGDRYQAFSQESHRYRLAESARGADEADRGIALRRALTGPVARAPADPYANL